MKNDRDPTARRFSAFKLKYIVGRNSHTVNGRTVKRGALAREATGPRIKSGAPPASPIARTHAARAGSDAEDDDQEQVVDLIKDRLVVSMDVDLRGGKLTDSKRRAAVYDAWLAQREGLKAVYGTQT